MRAGPAQNPETGSPRASATPKHSGHRRLIMRHHALALGFLALSCSLNANGAAGTIDDNRLLKAGADLSNWLSPGRDYSNQRFSPRSEEHTSELQSRSDLVCRLLLEKKKKKK